MYQSIIKLRSAVLVFLTHNMALPILQLIRKEEKFPYNMQQLMAMPAGSLGYNLAIFLHQKQLKLLPYYARHDIKHLLLEYDTTDEGEVCLQCFMLGNGHISFPVLATVLYGFATMPEHWSSFKTAYLRGKKAVAIAGWNWFSILPESLHNLQLQINKFETANKK